MHGLWDAGARPQGQGHSTGGEHRTCSGAAHDQHPHPRSLCSRGRGRGQRACNTLRKPRKGARPEPDSNAHAPRENDQARRHRAERRIQRRRPSEIINALHSTFFRQFALSLNCCKTVVEKDIAAIEHSVRLKFIRCRVKFSFYLEDLSQTNSGFSFRQISFYRKRKVQRRGGDLNSCSPGGEVGLEPTAFPG